MKKFFIFLTLFSFATMLRSSDSESDSSSRMNDMESRVTMLSHNEVSERFDSNLILLSRVYPQMSLYNSARESINQVLRTLRMRDEPRETYVQTLTNAHLSNSPLWALFFKKSMLDYARSLKRDIIELEKKHIKRERERAWERALENIRAMARSQPK